MALVGDLPPALSAYYTDKRNKGLKCVEEQKTKKKKLKKQKKNTFFS